MIHVDQERSIVARMTMDFFERYTADAAAESAASKLNPMERA